MTPKSILTWLQAIEKQTGYEILLAQAIRNSLTCTSVVKSGADKFPGDQNETEKYSLYLAAGLAQLSRAAVGLLIGMAVAAIGGILFAW
jgi:hypothetical protein